MSDDKKLVERWHEALDGFMEMDQSDGYAMIPPDLSVIGAATLATRVLEKTDDPELRKRAGTLLERATQALDARVNGDCGKAFSFMSETVHRAFTLHTGEPDELDEPDDESLTITLKLADGQNPVQPLVDELRALRKAAWRK